MRDGNGADTDSDLSVAYRALERRREEAIVERDRIADELKRLDAVLDALRALAGNVPGQAAVNDKEPALPASQPAESANAGTEAAPKLAAETATSATRMTRVIEFLLENPKEWFTVADIAAVTEQSNPSADPQNAVSKTVLRLLRHEAVQREDGRPARYRAVPRVLRELLMAAQ